MGEHVALFERTEGIGVAADDTVGESDGIGFVIRMSFIFLIH